MNIQELEQLKQQLKQELLEEMKEIKPKKINEVQAEFQRLHKIYRPQLIEKYGYGCGKWEHIRTTACLMLGAKEIRKVNAPVEEVTKTVEMIMERVLNS